MLKRYTVEIFGAGKGDEPRREEYDRKLDAELSADWWHNEGHAVIVHDNKTGEKIYDEM